MADALAISADAAHPQHPKARAGRAVASLRGLRRGVLRGMTGVAGELHAVWVSDYQ
jgi:hypothetical protein